MDLAVQKSGNWGNKLYLSEPVLFKPAGVGVKCCLRLCCTVIVAFKPVALQNYDAGITIIS
jgi:hypothetical protein